MTRHQLQYFALERLGHLVELHDSMDATWTRADRRLIEHALVATYQECERAGLRVIARAVIADMRSG